MSIGPVSLPVMPTGAVTPTQVTAPTTGSTQATQSFGDMLTNGIQQVENLQAKSDQLAVQAATGDLKDVHDYMVASTEAGLATQLTVAVRNKAVDAFNQIMAMPL